MYWVSVDVGAHYDARCPGHVPNKGMTNFGAVMISDPIKYAFYGRIRFIWKESNVVLPPMTAEGLEVVDFEGSLRSVMLRFEQWLYEMCLCNNPRFVSDNPAYDWQWINHAFWTEVGRNPFGHSAQNQGSLYKGMMFDMSKNFKHLRDQEHTHNSVDDALGNAQAFLKMRERGLRCGI